MNQDRLHSKDPLDPIWSYTLSAFLFWVITLSLWTHEQWEDKNKGYAFLKTLPIKDEWIIGAKFALVFLFVLLHIGIQLLMLAFVSISPEYFNPAAQYIINIGLFCLIVFGLLYIGIFKFGYPRFGKYVMIVGILLFISPLLIHLLRLSRWGIDRSDIFHFVTSINWIISAAICIPAFFGFYYISLKIKEY
jgi:hypothetical protein